MSTPSTEPLIRPILTHPYESAPSISSSSIINQNGIGGLPMLSLSSVTTSDWSDQGLNFSSSPTSSHPDQQQHSSRPFPAFPTSTSSANHNSTSNGSGNGNGRRVEDPEQHVQLTGASKIFSQLEVVKKLQSEIANAHAKLENVHRGGAGGDEEEEEWWEDAKADMEKGPDVGTMGKSKEEREKTSKAYQSMAEEFEDRQKGVEGIMQKLGELSSALKEFHALPSPVLFPQTANRIQKTSNPRYSRSARTSDPARAETAPHDGPTVQLSASTSRPGMERMQSFT